MFFKTLQTDIIHRYDPLDRQWTKRYITAIIFFVVSLFHILISRLLVMSYKGKFCFWLRLCIVLPLSDKANTWLGFIAQVGEGAGGGASCWQIFWQHTQKVSFFKTLLMPSADQKGNTTKIQIQSFMLYL